MEPSELQQKYAAALTENAALKRRVTSLEQRVGELDRQLGLEVRFQTLAAIRRTKRRRK
jgi:predicted phage-related endonuclease